MPAKLTEEEVAATLAAANLEALEPYPGTVAPWRCRCITCGATVSPRFTTIRQGQGGCWECGVAKRSGRPSAHRVPEDMRTTTLAAANLKPLGPYPGGQTPWPCICLMCGTKTSPRLNDLRQGQGGCRTCGERKTSSAQRGDADVAAIFMRKHGFEPLEPYPGSNFPWKCRCLKCNNGSTPRYAGIQQGSGCRNCAVSGFKTDKPAWVYLVERPTDGVRQYGVSNHPTRRLGRHRKAGFTIVVELLPCFDGRLAWEIEGDIKAHLKARGIGPAGKRREFNGWTETFAAAAAPDLRPSDFAPYSLTPDDVEDGDGK